MDNIYFNTILNKKIIVKIIAGQRLFLSKKVISKKDLSIFSILPKLKISI